MSSSSDESDILTPESIRTEESNVPENLLPTRSRDKYLRAYNNFIAWKDAKGEKSFSETVFLTYFQELAESKQPTTLWSTYSMLKSTVSKNNDIKIEGYTKLLTFLKRRAKGHKSKKSKVFSSENVATFLNEAPDNDFLAIKVALIFGVQGGCRGKELLNITVDDIEKHSDRLLLVKLKDTKTKYDRSFIIREEYKNIVEKYQALRPPDMETNRFFIRYHNGRCFKQVIGKNKICSMPQEIATYLNLPDPKFYTGHCFRRTSSTLLTHSGADLSELLRHGWKSEVKGHGNDFIVNKTQISSSIFENVSQNFEDSLISPLSRPSMSRERESSPIAHSGMDVCDLNLHEEWKSGTLAEVYIEGPIENRAQVSRDTVENVKLECSPNLPISPLSPCPSTSKCDSSPFAHFGTNTSDRKRHGEWKSSTVGEEYLEDSSKNKAQTHKHIAKNIKLETSAIPPLSPSPSTSKQCESTSSQSAHVFHGPDSIVITSTPTSTTISILNKSITITLEKCPDDTNSLNIKF